MKSDTKDVAEVWGAGLGSSGGPSRAFLDMCQSCGTGHKKRMVSRIDEPLRVELEGKKVPKGGFKVLHVYAVLAMPCLTVHVHWSLACVDMRQHIQCWCSFCNGANRC